MDSIATIEKLGTQATFGAAADMNVLGDNPELMAAFLAQDEQAIQKLVGSKTPMMMVLVPADDDDSDDDSSGDGEEEEIRHAA